ncbi:MULTISPECIES: HpcH/HpaI aldolase family protein [unclassified Sedimentibacter]|uniref:HpcH/HpaI aldolase family protein n=1 Tax=unclassified Sedimentibacter TaxID=2649220 RepID=UPI0027DF862E|nr:aldolase/citrate lyase family protein [Sedimentibacter sp. MB35-C1]WMJ77276.1 aldolase/citrate lyase family protein [Sedimentibacter sp. MB35-C1]
MINYTKQKMVKKEKTIGTFSELGTANAVEGLGYSGLDYIIIDTEHGPFAEESTMEFIRAAKLSKLTPFVRIKEISRAAVLKMLDIGAEGLIVPCVETVEQVKHLVKYGKYAPLGERGFFFGRATGYGFEDFTSPLEDYFNKCNNETMIIPQCETLGCLENIEEIASIDGVDAIFVGPYDLSISMGIPGQFDADKFKKALIRIVAACKKANKPVMIYANDMKSASKNFDMGFDSVAVSSDIAILTSSFISITNSLKSK